MSNATHKNPMERFVYWITERESIRRRREDRQPKPWTDDSILQHYRFCNVHREDDTVTRWIADNWRTHDYADAMTLPFAMCVARLVNWPDTLAVLGYPARWNAAQFVARMQARRAAGHKTFGGAYIVSTNGVEMDKAAYLAERVLTPLWAARRSLAPAMRALSLAAYHARLSSFIGMGSFMAAQVVADLKYVEPWRSADDWYAWAASGPGSRRGLNRLIGREVNAPWKERDWLQQLGVVHPRVQAAVKDAVGSLHAQDLQNCLCEFDKYERTRLGEGRPRATYNGI